MMTARLVRCFARRCAAVLAVLLAIGCTMKTPNSVIDERARIAIEAGKFEAAQFLLDRALWQDKTDAVAYYYLGRLRLEQNRPMDAQLAFEKAIAIEPYSPMNSQMLDGLAESLYRQNKTPQLASVLASATRDYGRASDFIRQGEYLGKAGDQDGAVLAFNKAAAVAAPDDAGPYLAMYRFYDSVGNGAKALEALKYAYYFRPGDPDLAAALRRYGVVPGPTVAVKPPSSAPEDLPLTK